MDYTRPASLRELVPALVHAGVLELAATCAALLVVSVLVLALQALFWLRAPAG